MKSHISSDQWVLNIMLAAVALLALVAFRLSIWHGNPSPERLPYPQLSVLMRVDSLQPFIPAEQIDQKRPIILCFLCGCHSCHLSAKRLASLSLHANHNVFGVFSIGPQDAKNFVNTTGFPGTPLLDANSVVADHYSASTCPCVFVLQGQKILYHTSENGRPLTEGELRHVARYL